jgi:hypothetical protein
LTACSFGPPFPTVLAEFDGCTEYVEDKLGQSGVWTGASPFGDARYEAAAKERFFVFRGVGDGVIMPDDQTNPFNLPSHQADANESAASFNGYVDRARAAGGWHILLIHTILPTTALWYNPVKLEDLTATIRRTRALGDVWIDTVANVGAYWLGQRIFSAATKVTTGNATTWTWTLPPHFPPGKALRLLARGGTLSQRGAPLVPSAHGVYEMALDDGELTLTR